MRGDVQAKARARGARVPPDDQADRLRALWDGVDRDDDGALRDLARGFLGDEALWERDLCTVPGLVERVGSELVRIEREGARTALAAHLDEASTASVLR